MNWKLVVLLSMFGLAMAIGSAFVIPPNVETPLWPAIFVLVAFLVAYLVTFLVTFLGSTGLHSPLAVPGAASSVCACTRFDSTAGIP